jgi:hypothetical protein
LITILFILNLTIEKVCTDSLVSSAIRIRCPLTIISVQVANSQAWLKWQYNRAYKKNSTGQEQRDWPFEVLKDATITN